MRTLVLHLLLLAASCASPGSPVPVDTALPQARGDLDRVVERFQAGWPEAELRIEALGEEGLSRVRPFLTSEDPDLRLRTLSVLLSAGEDIDLTDRERVELALFDLSRPAPQPWASLRGLGRLRAVGDRARPLLEEAARGDGDRAEAARRLLREELP